MILLGLYRIASGLSGLGLLAASPCGGDVLSMTHMMFVGDLALRTAPHCWGCPAIVAGAALLLAGLAPSRGRTFAIRRAAAR